METMLLVLVYDRASPDVPPLEAFEDLEAQLNEESPGIPIWHRTPEEYHELKTIRNYKVHDESRTEIIHETRILVATLIVPK